MPVLNIAQHELSFNRKGKSTVNFHVHTGSIVYVSDHLDRVHFDAASPHYIPHWEEATLDAFVECTNLIPTYNTGSLQLRTLGRSGLRLYIPNSVCVGVDRFMARRKPYINSYITWKLFAPPLLAPPTFTDEQWQQALAFEQDLPAAWFAYVDWLLDAGWTERAEQVRLLNT